jgi:hypothetical protein
MRPSAAHLACTLMASLALAPGVAGAAGASGTIAELNAQRAANGIPAGITEDPNLSAGCAAHDHYMAINHTLTHYEIAGNPGYTTEGDYAGRNAVLAQGADWATGNPYEHAPLHLDQLLAPRLTVLGSADAEGFTCTTTFPGWTRPDPGALTVYSYPGPGAAIYPSEVARELPWTPGQLVGIPAGARTGPYIVVLVDAPGQSPKVNPATLTNATLAGPSGPVAVRTVDGTTAIPGGSSLGQYISPGGFIIPVTPLVPGARYQAHVLVGFAGVQTPHDWSFTARLNDPQSILRARGSKLSFNSLSPRPIRVRFVRAGGGHAPTLVIRPAHSARLHLAPGSWQACGYQAPAAGFDAYSACLALTVTGRPIVRLSAPRIGAGQLSFRLRFSPVLRGRYATLTLTPLVRRCIGRHCRTVAASPHPSVRTVVLRSDVLRVPAPAAGHGVQLTLSTAAFQLRDAPWTSARAAFRYFRR